MTAKRFINDIDIGQLIDTKGELSTIDYSDKVDFYELWEFLNKLNDENEQLKKELDKLKVVNEMLSMDFTNSEHELWRENEQLKQSNERLLKMLDNVANYMQKQNKYMPIDDFVEWWNGIATKGLDDGDDVE